MDHQTQEPSTSRASPPTDTRDQPTGLQSVLAGATALVAMFTAMNPASGIAQALNEALPTVGRLLPPLIAAVGTVVAAFSHPPKFLQRL